MSFQENAKNAFFLILKKKRKIRILEHWSALNINFHSPKVRFQDTMHVHNR